VTKIEWTDETWNPTRGCSRVSEGCRNCYAEQIASRFNGTKIIDGKRQLRPFAGFAIRTGHGPQWTGRVELIESKLTEPLHWKAPRRVFVNSMSDLFHEALPDEAIDRVFAVMALCPQHTFQVLTKRADRMRIYASGPFVRIVDQMVKILGKQPHGQRYPFPNVWLGVSVEDQPTADTRIPELQQTPAALRFVSYEPALAGVDFRRWLPIDTIGGVEMERWLDWGIVGGESGPQARPCDLAWIESTVDQFQVAGRPLFVKQLGAKPFQSKLDHFSTRYPITDSKGGNWDDWPAKLRVREFPK
jgi:protein gp37